MVRVAHVDVRQRGAGSAISRAPFTRVGAGDTARELAATGDAPAGLGDRATTAPADASEVPVEAGGEPVTAAASAPADPWGALLRFGAEFAAALGAAAADRGETGHPWIERDARTGARKLAVPLPPPETVRQIADALSLVAQALRGHRG